MHDLHTIHRRNLEAEDRELNAKKIAGLEQELAGIQGRVGKARAALARLRERLPFAYAHDAIDEALKVLDG